MEMNASIAAADPAIQNAMLAGTSAMGGKGVKNAANMAHIDKASKDFEAMFMSQMLQPMFETMEVDDTFGGGHGEQVMRSLMVQEYGKAMAKSDNFGLSDSIKAQMIRMQEDKAQSKTVAANSVAAYANKGATQ